MDAPNSPSISSQQLYGAIGISAAPLVIDLRKDDPGDPGGRMLVSALRRDPDDVGRWRRDLSPARPVVTHCARGHEVSQGVAAVLREGSINARYLDVQGFVKGCYAAAIGTILGACVLLGKIAIGDWLTVLIALGSLAILFRFKVSNPLLVGATAVIGLVAFPLLEPAWVMVK
jgi:rhodanese-related sulfurtransferase